MNDIDEAPSLIHCPVFLSPEIGRTSGDLGGLERGLKIKPFMNAENLIGN